MAIEAMNNRAISIQNALYNMASNAGKPRLEVVQANVQANIEDDITKKTNKDHLKQELLQIANDTNRRMKEAGIDINFSYNDDIEGLVITVKEAGGGKIVREVPTKEAIDLAKRMHEIAGLLFDKKV